MAALPSLWWTGVEGSLSYEPVPAFPLPLTALHLLSSFSTPTTNASLLLALRGHPTLAAALLHSSGLPMKFSALTLPTGLSSGVAAVGARCLPPILELNSSTLPGTVLDHCLKSMLAFAWVGNSPAALHLLYSCLNARASGEAMRGRAHSLPALLHTPLGGHLDGCRLLQGAASVSETSQEALHLYLSLSSSLLSPFSLDTKGLASLALAWRRERGGRGGTVTGGGGGAAAAACDVGATPTQLSSTVTIHPLPEHLNHMEEGGASRGKLPPLPPPSLPKDLALSLPLLACVGGAAGWDPGYFGVVGEDKGRGKEKEEVVAGTDAGDDTNGGGGGGGGGGSGDTATSSAAPTATLTLSSLLLSLDFLLSLASPPLHTHLDALGVTMATFAFRWVATVSLNVEGEDGGGGGGGVSGVPWAFPGEGVAWQARVLMSEGWGGWLRVIVGVLALCEGDLLGCLSAKQLVTYLGSFPRRGALTVEGVERVLRERGISPPLARSLLLCCCRGGMAFFSQQQQQQQEHQHHVLSPSSTTGKGHLLQHSPILHPDTAYTSSLSLATQGGEGVKAPSSPSPPSSSSSSPLNSSLPLDLASLGVLSRACGTYAGLHPHTLTHTTFPAPPIIKPLPEGALGGLVSRRGALIIPSSPPKSPPPPSTPSSNVVMVMPVLPPPPRPSLCPPPLSTSSSSSSSSSTIHPSGPRVWEEAKGEDDGGASRPQFVFSSLTPSTSSTLFHRGGGKDLFMLPPSKVPPSLAHRCGVLEGIVHGLKAESQQQKERMMPVQRQPQQLPPENLAHNFEDEATLQAVKDLRVGVVGGRDGRGGGSSSLLLSAQDIFSNPLHTIEGSLVRSKAALQLNVSSPITALLENSRKVGVGGDATSPHIPLSSSSSSSTAPSLVKDLHIFSQFSQQAVAPGSNLTDAVKAATLLRATSPSPKAQALGLRERLTFGPGGKDFPWEGESVVSSRGRFTTGGDTSHVSSSTSSTTSSYSLASKAVPLQVGAAQSAPCPRAMALFGSVVSEVLQQQQQQQEDKEGATETKEAPYSMASPPSYTSRAFSLHSIGSTHVPLETYLRAPPGNAGVGGGEGVVGFLGVEGENSAPLFFSNNPTASSRGDGGGGGGMDPVLAAENLALERGAKSLTVGSGRSATGDRIRALAMELLNAK